MKPTIGRIVRFVGVDMREWPAIITVVHSDALVSLQVFGIGAVIARTSVPRADAAEGFVPVGYTWHWPDRAS